MMCKVFVLATAALVTGLLVVSDARSVMSKFKYSGNSIGDEIVIGGNNQSLGGVNITARHGVLKGFNHVKNVSDWVPLFGKGYAAISQNVTFPQLSSEHNQTELTFPTNKTLNRLAFNFVGNVNFTANATRNAEGGCQLEFSAITEQRVSVNGTTDSYLVKTLERLPHLKDRLQSDVLRSVENIFAFLAPMVVKQKLEARIPLDELCDKLQKHNFQHLVGRI